MDLSTTLKHYKREEIQKAIVRSALNREVAVKFGDHGFGKRPDTLEYPADVLEMAKQRATSFHVSEEIWKNPLQLDIDMQKKDIEKLRIGWDLVIDIDCLYWDLSKLTAWIIVESLKDLGIKNISIKFSGNKGFHIGVPFESFPKTFNNKPTASLFPEAPRKIAEFLIGYIGNRYLEVKENEIIIAKKFKISIEKIIKATGKTFENLAGIKKTKPQEKSFDYICSRCENHEILNKDIDYLECKKCGSIMEKFEKAKVDNKKQKKISRFDASSIIEMDTLLISQRHLYRMPYSLHEKSGLVSIPFNPEKILKFEKELADPKNVKISKHKFLDSSKSSENEAAQLLLKAYEFKPNIGYEKSNFEKDFEIDTNQEAIPKELFPPCIKNMLSGMKDGRKRAVFILINFLKNMNWNYEDIENEIYEWNKRNPESLREVIVKGQLRYRKSQQKILPPNCANKDYYQDFAACTPDNFCNKIKNPVNYAKLKARAYKKEIGEKSRKQKPELSEKQKEFIKLRKEKEKEFKKRMKENQKK